MTFISAPSTPAAVATACGATFTDIFTPAEVEAALLVACLTWTSADVGHLTGFFNSSAVRCAAVAAGSLTFFVFAVNGTAVPFFCAGTAIFGWANPWATATGAIPSSAPVNAPTVRPTAHDRYRRTRRRKAVPTPMPSIAELRMLESE
ncbi:hypothetical protein [Streptomyces sp. CA2R106]|uniref:hypothetical protein n=1 Tax=Streptomyces sp. CA2R106 TaxID=3120153 RepID=UPI00300ADACB